jgi:hypothetical protein
MRRLVVAVRDRASDTFGQPFYVVARGQAIRSFSDEINRVAQDNPLNAHPDDFDLYELGTYEDSTGMFETGVPVMVAVGKDLVTREDSVQRLRAVQ